MGTEATIHIKIVIFLIYTFLEAVPRNRIGIKVMIDVHSRYATACDPDLVIHSKDLAAALEVYRGMGELWQIDPKREWISAP